MKPKQETMIRFNARVRKDQFKFVREEAKRQKVGEGEMQRIIIDYYISNRK